MKRIPAVLWWASDNDEEAGAALVKALVSAMRAVRAPTQGRTNYPGTSAVEALREAFDNMGWTCRAMGCSAQSAWRASKPLR
jgi:hypothetical protein